ncbi:MAG: response regulator transcription factor [Opitutaceae bacterium]|nr:response regulator transcription factor [Opitutaceae bacterium]
MSSKILVVDDEPEAREVIGTYLRQAGFAALFAGDGATALTIARTELPALIVLDVMLPQMDGFEVCRVLRREATTATIPMEFKLLETLIRDAGRVYRREELLRQVWHHETGSTSRTVDTHMRRLREKLGPAARHLETVRGIGYRFSQVFAAAKT